jgi:hypothetical protein
MLSTRTARRLIMDDDYRVSVGVESAEKFVPALQAETIDYLRGIIATVPWVNPNDSILVHLQDIDEILDKAEKAAKTKRLGI